MGLGELARCSGAVSVALPSLLVQGHAPRPADRAKFTSSGSFQRERERVYLSNFGQDIGLRACINQAKSPAKHGQEILHPLAK